MHIPSTLPGRAVSHIETREGDGKGEGGMRDFRHSSLAPAEAGSDVLSQVTSAKGGRAHGQWRIDANFRHISMMAAQHAKWVVLLTAETRAEPG